MQLFAVINYNYFHMTTMHNQQEAEMTRKKMNRHSHELSLLEEEKGILPTEIYLQRKMNLQMQIDLMQASFNDGRPAKTVMVY